MPLMIKLNRNIMKVDLCLDNGHFITVIYTLIFLFEISIIYLQFNKNSNIFYIALPIIINLICHYMFF